MQSAEIYETNQLPATLITDIYLKEGKKKLGNKYTLCFGGRRRFCKTDYADLGESLSSIIISGLSNQIIRPKIELII